jgi:DNA repair protein RecN (Recombination protein N)
MLEALSIQNIVLIDELHIEFEASLCILTGETGAGKSILLDALGLALGARAEARLLRPGASHAQVTAAFRLPSTHPLWEDIEEQEIPCERGELLLRRSLRADGKSQCFLNDQLISQALMRRLGQELVEVHGQFDQLLDAKTHLRALDIYGKVDKGPAREAFKAYQTAKATLKTFQDTLSKAFERQAFLRFAIEELEKASPKPREETQLVAEKSLISHQAKLADALMVADQHMAPLMTNLSQTHRVLSRIQDLLPEKVTPLVEAADRAMVEVQEVLEGIKELENEVDGSSSSLELIENRLHTLRSLSRKYQSDDLTSCLADLKSELLTLDQGEDHILSLEEDLTVKRAAYLAEAHALSCLRQQAAQDLERAVALELPPLKLGHARFRIHFEESQEESWKDNGLDHVEFYIQTNPGTPEGPLSAVASGGELSRLMLALKVILAQAGTIPTLIFDEIESGTGGAVASAMGERLKDLSQNSQILAITHSPQIAAQGNQHLVVLKQITETGTTTHVKPLAEEGRYEEVARMLAGQEITEEARAAAKRLMGGG